MITTSKTIVECVPNFSEGRDEQIIQAIADALGSVSGAQLLHQTSDYDHNRSVFTLAGEPQAVLEAVFCGIGVAIAQIDLQQQTGEHPRVGAADVVPLIPIANCTIEDCIRWAHDLGERIGTQLGLPVYLYEYAATRPERRNLADLRRGGYEHLQAVIHQSDHAPDYGPSQMGNAGAVLVGVRDILIAYNIFLDTDDISIARKIARSIRASNGGLTHVKALGMLVEGSAQVSMNLIDYRITPVYRVIELVRIEAKRYGVNMVRSELIGLIPQQALIDCALWYLQLPDDTHHQILEYQLNTWINTGAMR